MLIVSYDIESDKVRTKFSKFLKRYGRRLQLSVFEVKNSPRVLENIKAEIEHNLKKRFTNNDSVLIYSTCRACDAKIERFGHPVQEEKAVVFFSWQDGRNLNKWKKYKSSYRDYRIMRNLGLYENRNLYLSQKVVACHGAPFASFWLRLTLSAL